jgi:predicted RNA-binding Zn-ribbon protein involved in translation (DUF1610 family)/ribosomal protein S20
MSKSLRLTEKWMHRGLWLVAIVFASFLIGLGGAVVGDLPKVEKPLSQGDFMDRAASTALRNAIKATERAEQDAAAALEQAQLKRRVAQADTAAARETFNNWLATRRATQLSDQDAELVSRTRALDALLDSERTAGMAVETQQQAMLDAQQGTVRERRKLAEMEQAAQLPDAQRREDLSYDTALTRLSKGVCPGCERPVDLKNPEIDFCPHCGIGLFERCLACKTRKSAFAKFCHACGVTGERCKMPEPATGQA